MSEFLQPTAGTPEKCSEKAEKLKMLSPLLLNSNYTRTSQANSCLVIDTPEEVIIGCDHFQEVMKVK